MTSIQQKNANSILPELVVAVLEPAPKLRPPVPNPVLPKAGVVVPNVGAALAPNADVVVAPGIYIILIL